MNKTKSILFFSILLLIGTSFTIFPREVKAANYNVSVGDTWTTSYTGGGTNVQTAFKVTSVSSSSCIGDIYEIGSDDVGEEETSQNLASSYVKDLSSWTSGNADFTETYTYGGRSLTCYGYRNPSSTTRLLIIDSVTGIIVEREDTNGKERLLISWEYLTTRGGIPGYDLPILLGITAIFSIGTILYIRKKQI